MKVEKMFSVRDFYRFMECPTSYNITTQYIEYYQNSKQVFYYLILLEKTDGTTLVSKKIKTRNTFLIINRWLIECILTDYKLKKR